MTISATALTPFLNLHQGEIAWLFGKGPSLDGFNFSEAGPLRCAINDVVSVVPGVVYGFAHDNAEPWADLYEETPDDFILFQPWRTAIDAVAPPCSRHVFWDEPGFPWDRTREEAARNGLIQGQGTLSGALQILWVMGVSEIRCVGIDGGKVHAAITKWRTQLTNRHTHLYNDIKDEFIKRADQLGQRVSFYGKNTNEENDMKIRITRDTFVRGNFVAAGTEIDVTDPVANELLYSRVARKVPAVPVVETAAAEPTREVATKRPTTRKKASKK